MFKKLTSIKNSFKRSPEEKEFENFLKTYASLFNNENTAKRETHQLTVENCRLVVLKQSPLLVCYDSASEKGPKPSQSGNGNNNSSGSQQDSIFTYTPNQLGDLAFGNCDLHDTRTANTCMKVHTFSKSDHIVVTMVCRMRKLHGSRLSNEQTTASNGKSVTKPSSVIPCFCHTEIPQYNFCLLNPPHMNSRFISPLHSENDDVERLSSHSSGTALTRLPFSPRHLTQYGFIPSSLGNNMAGHSNGSVYSRTPSLFGGKSGDSIGGSCINGYNPNSISATSGSNHSLYCSSPGSAVRFIRSLTSSMGVKPVTPPMNHRRIFTTQSSGCDAQSTVADMPQTTSTKSYLAICILCAPPKHFWELSIASMNPGMKSSPSDEANGNSRINKELCNRWRDLLGSPFHGHIFQHMALLEGILHQVMHSTYDLLSQQNIHTPHSSSLSLSISSSTFSRSSVSSLNAFNQPIAYTSYRDIYYRVVLQRLNDLLFAPRLQHPIWLSITANEKQRADGSGVTARQFQLTRLFVYDCLIKLIGRFDEDSKLGKESFLCRLLTAVLANHPYWVCTVVPGGGKLSKKHLSKHQAAWADELMQTFPYHAEWAQLNDLFGGIHAFNCHKKDECNLGRDHPHFCRTFCRTVLIGQNKQLVNCLLYLLSYFIRCANATVTEERVPEIGRSDLWDLRERRRKRSLSSQGTSYPSSLGGDSGVSSSHEDLYNSTVVLAGPSSTVTSCSVPTQCNLPNINMSNASTATVLQKCPSGSGMGSRSGSSGGLCRLGGQLTEDQRKLATEFAKNYSQYNTCSLSQKAVVVFLNDNYMEVPLLIENTRIRPDDLWRQLYPELMNVAVGIPSHHQLSSTSTSSGVADATAGSSPSDSYTSHFQNNRPECNSSAGTNGIQMNSGTSPWYSNIGHSVFLPHMPRYVEGNSFVLQGTNEPVTHWEGRLRNDLQMAVWHHSCLDGAVGLASAIVADVDSSTVRIVSCRVEPGTIREENIRCGSTLVAQLLQTIRCLGNAGLSPEALMQRLERGLADLYHRSVCLASVLFTASEPCEQIIREKNVYSMMNVQEDDVPLLKGIANLIYVNRMGTTQV